MFQSQRRSEPAQPPAFGGRIRNLRRKAGLTLQALADQAGISVGFLSQVERDLATPSLGTLASIAGALNVDIDFFVATPRPADSVTRAGERDRFALADSSLHYERISTVLPGGTLSSLIIHIPVGYASEVTAHVGEELIVVLDGTVKQTLADVTLVLHPGDSLHFMGDVPHSFANIGEAPARLLWTGTSPRMIGPIVKRLQPEPSQT
ncbi:XRE family transcriptional regulator [Cognatiyoonia sp. IB215446]|uniref:helix-turn-helix domain-containing protein n=1 Tax=Cognatiyoonia sp. IB215446 TaxID=3097355 RepID=UPI002A174E94|nr:XRE family transcriptional regulator [Cognatiyoonia sp. IB215446]MDX8348113.1 XRE family transcriptional regulator [Cognatiyoonia sp. IB215446]